MENRILIGEFGRAHGVRGEVRLRSFTEDPLAIASYSPLTDEDGTRFTLAHLRAAKGPPGEMLVARVEGVASREEAEALAGTKLYLPRERLPEPEPDEFYLADLIGLGAEDESGRNVGSVIAVHDFGAGDILEIAPAGGGRTVMVPFSKAFVPTVSVAARRLVIAANDFLDETPDTP